MQRATAGVDEYDSAEVNPWDLRLVEILRLVAKVVQSNPTFAIIRLERYLIERAKVTTEIVTEALASSNLSRVNEETVNMWPCRIICASETPRGCFTSVSFFFKPSSPHNY